MEVKKTALMSAVFLMMAILDKCCANY